MDKSPKFQLSLTRNQRHNKCQFQFYINFENRTPVLMIPVRNAFKIIRTLFWEMINSKVFEILCSSASIGCVDAIFQC